METKEPEIRLAKAISITVSVLIGFVLLWTFLGYSFIRQRGDFTTRLDNEKSRYEDQLTSVPVNIEALFHLGWTYYQKKNLDRAEDVYLQVIALKPKHAGARYNLGLVYLDKGKYALAEKEFIFLVTRYPRHKDALVGLGKSQIELGKFAEADVVLRQALVLEPTSADAHYFLGLALEKKASLEEARKEYKLALRYVPDYQQALQALKRVNEAFGLEESGNEY